MERSVTLGWLNCLSNRRVKLRKLTDSVIVDYLYDLLVKFQFCPLDEVRSNNEERKKLIIKFLKTKIADYNDSRLFINEEATLIACWLFLFHLVWSLEDSTLRNHLSFHLDNSSQEFIKSFLESLQEHTELNESIVVKCLRYASDKCAHLEKSPQEYVSRSSSNSTPNNTTPTGIKRKISLTLREYLLSPNAQKKFVEEHTKELKRLKVELQNEITEKVEVIEENENLRQKLEHLNRQLEGKISENASLKQEIEAIESNLNDKFSRINDFPAEKKQLSDLQITVAELQSYVATLEKENGSISKQLSLKEKTLISLTEESNSLRKQFTDLQLALINKDEVIERLNYDKEFFKAEMNNLKEFNQELTEKIAVLESSRPSRSESKAPNLESELQLQMMKDTIEWAKKNMTVIETEQTRLISENQSLNERVKNLVDEKKEIDSTLKDLNNRIDTLKKENISLKSFKETLNKKLKQTETKLLNSNRDYESYKMQSESCTKKLLEEKELLHHEIGMLKQSLEQYATLCEELHDREECVIADNERLETELDKARDHLLRNESQLEDFNVQMEHVKSENLKLSKKLNDVENQNKSLNAALTEISKDKNKWIKNNEELEKKLAKNKETIESLVKQTSQEQDRSAELRKMTEVHLKKIEQSENTLKKLEEERLDFNKRINILNEELKLADSRYRYEADTNDKAKIKLNEYEQINSEQKSKNERLETDLKSKQLENKTLQCRIKELEEYLQETEHNNEKLKSLLNELTKEKDKICTKCHDMEQKLKLDQNFIESLSDQLRQVQNQRVDLESKIKSLSEQLDSEQNAVQELRNENTKLVYQYNDVSNELKNNHVLYHNEIKVNESLHLKINDLLKTVSEQREQIESVEKQRDTMSSANHALEEKLRRTERELKHDRDQLVKYKEDVEFLQNEQKTLREELSSLETSLQVTEVKNKQLEDSIEEIKREKVLLEDLQSQLQKESNFMKDSLEKLQSEKQTVSDKLIDLTHQHQNLLNERITLVDSVKSFESQIPLLNKEITSLHNEITLLKDANESLKDQLVQLTSQMESVKEEKFAKIAQYDSMVQQLQNLENTYSDILKNKQKLEKSNAEKQTVIETLQDDLKSASTLNSQFNEKLQRLESETSHLRDQLDTFMEKSKNLQTENQSLNDTVIRLETSNQQLSANYKNLTKQKQLESDQYELKISALNEDVLKMQNLLKELNQTKESQLKHLHLSKTTLLETQIEKEILQKEYSNLVEEKQRIDLDYQNETNHVERLKNKIAELEKLFGDQTTEMKLLKNDYSRSKDDNHRLNDQLQELENDICELQERLKASIRETETLDNEKKTLLKKIVDFENSFEELHKQNETLSRNLCDISSEKATIAEEKESLQKRTEECNDIIQSLTNEIASLQSSIDKLSHDNKSYEEQLKSAESKLKAMTENKLEFQEKYEKIYEELVEVQSQYHTTVENNAKLKIQITHFEQISNAQKSQIEQLEQTLSNKTSKLSDVEKKLVAVVEQHITETLAIKSENERLSEENKNYLDAVKRLEELQCERESLLSTLEQKESKLMEITARWQQELNTMREERTRDADKINKLLEDCKIQQKSVVALKEELIDLQKRYEELQEEKTRALSELRDMFLHQIDQLLSNNEMLKTENTKLLDSNKEKSWYLKEMHKRIKPIIDALEEHEKKILLLKEQNETLTKEIDECNGNKWTLKSQNEQLTALVAQTDKEKERLNKEIQNLKDEKEMLRFKTDELKLDNEEIKNDNSRLRKLMRKGSNEHEELKKQADLLNENVEKIQQDSEKLARENNELKQYIDQLKVDREKELNAKVIETEKFKTSIQELRNEIEDLRNEEDNLKKSNEKMLEERNTTLDQKIIFEQDNIKIKRRLDELIAQKNEVYNMNELNNKAYENRIQALISQNDDQLITIQNLRGENEVLRSEMEEVKTNAAISTRKQVEKLNSKLNEMDELHKKEIASLSEANHRLQVKVEKQTLLNKSLESKLENYKELVSAKDLIIKRVDELKVKLEESLEQNERLTDEVNLISDRNAALVKENENLLSKVEELETKMDTLNDTIGAKDKEILMLQDEYRIFKDEYRKLSEHKNELDKDWKESLIGNFKSATAKCEKLTNEMAEKQSIIAALEAEVQRIKESKVDLNETHVIASGPDNKTDIILKEENQKLAEEVENLKKKLHAMKIFVDKEREILKQKNEKLYPNLNAKIEAEYAGKLERAKNEYNKVVLQKVATKESEWKKREEEYQKVLRKEKEHIKELSAQLWDMSDKYLRLKQNVESYQCHSDFRRCSVDNIFSPRTLSRRTQSATHLNMIDGRFPKALDFDRRLSTMSEDIQYHTKNKKQLALTSGKKFSLSSAKVFPTEDEEDMMEIFDNACLADLKLGRMDESDFSKSRLSQLQARNSLCPPHLKSSYPAETQFIPPQEFKENDIKMGLSSCDNEHSDVENLLPGDRSRKNRNQTSYKKPGPPTPSKHGGRASTIGVETPRNVLKDSNSNGTARRKSFTPKIFNFFPMRGHATVTAATSQHNHDENPSVTPKRNRLQSLRRRFSKNPQELGNTNSGYS